MQFEISEFEILSILQIGGDVESISRTVTCTGELSTLMCYSQGGRISYPPLSRLSYPVLLYTLIQLSRLSKFSLLSLYLVSVRYLVPYILDAHNKWYINYVSASTPPALHHPNMKYTNTRPS